jgi:chromosomal replication initiation ATPase DnaA
MEEIINKLESIISNIFNITIEELRDNRKLRSHTDARSILFYFLHVKYGISSIVYLRFIINITLL